MGEQRITRRRQQVRDLLAEGASQRDIARRLGVDESTIRTDRRHLESETRPGPPAPPIGNSRALRHGAQSEQRLAPLRDTWAQELRTRYPEVDEIRLGVLADRCARFDSARAWLDQQGGVVRNPDGDVFAVVDRAEKWASRIESIVAELEAERRPVNPGAALAAHLNGRTA